MLTYRCPKCGKTLQSPESEAGETVDCPDCQNVIRIPTPAKSSLPVWFLIIIIALIGGCGCIVVCLVAITALGTSANKTFGTVGGQVGGQPVVKQKAIKPAPPVKKNQDN
jgi:phage FluMu protein Com